MPKKKHNVMLPPTEEQFLRSITKTGRDYSARELLRAQILLHGNDSKPDEKESNKDLAKWLGVSPTTINAVRRAYSQGGLEHALHRKTRLTPPIAARILVDGVTPSPCRTRLVSTGHA